MMSTSPPNMIPDNDRTMEELQYILLTANFHHKQPATTLKQRGLTFQWIYTAYGHYHMEKYLGQLYLIQDSFTIQIGPYHLCTIPY